MDALLQKEEKEMNDIATLPNSKELTTSISKSIPNDHEMMVFNTMATHAVSSKMYKNVGDKSGVMMIMLAARELGIPPMQALNGGLNIIQGRVEISARMMNALIRKAGHQINKKESTNTKCVLIGKRVDTGETSTSTYSIEDARMAGLVKQGGGWTKFPQDMCYARALSRLARQLYSDVIGIGYVEGEIRATEAPVDVPKDEPRGLSKEVHVDLVSHEDNLKKLLDMFEKDDRFLVMDYMKVVMKHFDWSQEECVTKFLGEDGLVDKFNKWKAKTVVEVETKEVKEEKQAV